MFHGAVTIHFYAKLKKRKRETLWKPSTLYYSSKPASQPLPNTDKDKLALADRKLSRQKSDDQ